METSVICKYMWICVHVTPLDCAMHFCLMYLFCLLWPALCTHRLLSVPAARALLSTSIHHHYTCPDAGPLLNHSLPYLDLQDRPGQGRAGRQQTTALQHCISTAYQFPKCEGWMVYEKVSAGIDPAISFIPRYASGIKH